MNKEFIDKIVDKITSNGNITTLSEIAKDNHILIHEVNLGSGGGYYFYEKRFGVIILNDSLSYHHKLIVLAHEIAHALLHPYENAHFTSIGIRSNKKENEANYFACRLLDVIGFWENDNLCVYEHEMSKSDKGFINIYKNYMRGDC